MGGTGQSSIVLSQLLQYSKDFSIDKRERSVILRGRGHVLTGLNRRTGEVTVVVQYGVSSEVGVIGRCR